jgi:hypothetical protein
MAEAPPPNRTQIPNIVDDLGLDPYERALYVHYKRVCGENQGAYCYEATRTTAGKVKMSAGQVSQARKSLTERGLIIVQAETRPVVVTIVNIWEINTAFYKLEYRPDVDTWTIEQVQVWLCDMSTDVHTVNVSSHNDIDTRSPDEHILTEQPPDVHTVNIGNNMSTDVHTVKQRRVSSLIESSPKKESLKELSPQQKLFLALAELCHIELRAASDKQKGQLGKASKALVNLVTDLDQFKEKFPVYWLAMDWRGQKGQSPDPPQIQEAYGDYCHWLKNGAKASGQPFDKLRTQQQQKASQNGHRPTKQPSPDYRPAFERRAQPYTQEDIERIARGEKLERP